MPDSKTRAPAKRQKTALPATAGQQTSEKLVGRLAQRYGVAADALLGTLRDTVFKGNFSDTELAAALVLAEKYDLNPFAKEIYCVKHDGALLIIVPIDGWAKLANRHPEYDGCEFEYKDGENGNVYSTKCRIYRKDRSRPTEVTEFYDECYRNTGPWKQWPRRMLRHKAFIQAVRLAFSLSEAVDNDEAARMGIRDPEYHVVEDRAPVLAQVERPAPTEVKAPEPTEENDAPEPEPDLDSEEAKRAKAKLFTEWKGIRNDLSAEEIEEVRKFASVGLIDTRCSLAQLEAVMRKASEIMEGKRE